MRRVLWLAMALIVASGLGAGVGCKDDTKPNPDLKPPDVPPGGRDKGKEPANKQPGKK